MNSTQTGLSAQWQTAGPMMQGAQISGRHRFSEVRLGDVQGDDADQVVAVAVEGEDGVGRAAEGGLHRVDVDDRDGALTVGVAWEDLEVENEIAARVAVATRQHVALLRGQ